MVVDIFFYVFSTVLIGSALFVVTARNPVHAVLFLILSFFNAAGLFIILGAEFLAMILVVVYVGAVAVLFLFVVMMLDIDFRTLRQGFLNYLPIGGAVGGVLLAELLVVTASWFLTANARSISTVDSLPGNVSNTEALGRVLYTQYVLLFQAAGLVLLVAMIGAIVLTLRPRQGVKSQNVGAQVARTRLESVAVQSVPSCHGVESKG